MLLRLFPLVHLFLLFFLGCNNPLVPGGNSSVSFPSVISSPQAFNLNFVSSSDSSIHVSWTNSTFAAKYSLLFRHPSDLNYKLFRDSAASPFIVSGLENGVNYSFMVIASNLSGSINSNVIQAIPNPSHSAPVLSYSASTGISGLVGLPMSVLPSEFDNSGLTVSSCIANPELPLWASIDSSNCVISGTPTLTLPPTAYAVTATNSVGSTVAYVNLSVAASVPVINYSPEAMTGKFGVPITIGPSLLNNSGAPITSCTVSPVLPSWATIDGSTCLISGTPTAILASTNFSVTATNSVGSTMASLILSVDPSAPVLSYSVGTVNGNVGVSLMVAPIKIEGSGTAITSCNVSPALPGWATINGLTCIISGIPLFGLDQTTFTVTASNSVGSTSSSFTLFVASHFCPANFIRAPGNISLGVVSDFCVAKYEMKNNAGVATSQPIGSPWVNISQVEAQAKCHELGSRYDLISNPEWMTIAYSIELSKTNWTNSAIGYGIIYRGHTDNSPNSLLPVNDDSNFYSGTGNSSSQVSGSGKEQRRTHTLSNDEVIWDFAGNAWEWTDWSIGGGLEKGPTTCGSSWFQLPILNCGALYSIDYLPSNPGNITSSSYNSAYGLGQVLVGSGGAALRGGNFSFGSRSGIFSLSLADKGLPSSSNGFRCVYRPLYN